MGKSPTQRSLEFARRQKWVAAVVERWNPFAKIRQDLFGFIDIIVLTKNEIVGVQVTSGSNHVARKKKALASQHYPAWAAVAPFEVWSWSKKGARWSLRRERISDLEK